MAQLGSLNDAGKEGRETGKRKEVFHGVGERDGKRWKGLSRFSQVEKRRGEVRPSTSGQLSFSASAVQVNGASVCVCECDFCSIENNDS